MVNSLSTMEVFVRVAQEGSFSAAARSLGLTPSAVSKQISRLEDRLGARLIARTTRQLALTEEGRAFQERAERILADVTEAEQAVSQMQGAVRGTLRVNLPVAFGRLHVAPLIADFLAEHPALRMEIIHNDRYVDLIEEGVDLAVRIGELRDSTLIARRLAPNRRVICASPAYLEREGRPRRPGGPGTPQLPGLHLPGIAQRLANAGPQRRAGNRAGDGQSRGQQRRGPARRDLQRAGPRPPAALARGRRPEGRPPGRRPAGLPMRRTAPSMRSIRPAATSPPRCAASSISWRSAMPTRAPGAPGRAADGSK